jgi:hypothetical protein
MTDKEKQRAFERAQRERLRAQTALVRNAQTEIDRLMRVAIGSIRNILSDAPSDFQRWRLPQVELEIRRALDVFGTQAAASRPTRSANPGTAAATWWTGRSRREACR